MRSAECGVGLRNSELPTPHSALGRMPQEQVTLACTECQRRNYNTSKNKKNVTDRLELRRYCKWCRKHTSHKETK